MFIKIYFGEKTLYIADKVEPPFEASMHHPETILIDEITHHAAHALLHEIKKEVFHTGILIHPDFEAAKDLIFKHFTCIDAAGGIVENEKQEILFIHRLDKWDLPKGKMETGESYEACAQREIMEETGLRTIHLLNKTGVTYHCYEAYGKEYLKTNHWYHFSGSSENPLSAQIEEDITEVRWFLRGELSIPLSNTYPSIVDILQQFQACRS